MVVDRRPPRGGLLRPYPFEITALAGLVAAVVFLRAQGLRIDWRTFEYTIPPLLPAMARYLLIGILAYVVYLKVRRRPLLPYVRRCFSAPWLLLTLRIWLGISVFTYTYFWLKVCVPLVNPRLWDPLLWQLDRLLHLGFSPSLFLVELARGTILVPVLDRWYAWWLPSVSLGIAFFVAFPGAIVRRRFALSCVLIWTLGAWMYVAMPALGPVYAFPDQWSELLEAMPGARGGQALLLENYQKILAGRSSDLKQFNPTRGIAAMPSLHVGVHWLIMLWLRKYARPLFLPAVLATVMTFIGSIVTGWHYAVDGYVGIALGQLSYWMANRLERGPASARRVGPDQESEACRYR